MTAKLIRLNKGKKKYKVILNKKNGRTKTIQFGQRGYSDYTRHKDPERKRNYIARHRTREDWNKSGIETAGFWSRWLLWNKPTIHASMRDIERRFKVKFK